MNEVDERWDESNRDLVTAIRDEILEQGPITFARFMELALYHDPHGYYRSAQPRPGRSGDFLTAPEAHPIFGSTLAAQIVDFDETLGHPEPFTIVEYGAGAGLLIRPLLSELRQQHPALYERVQYKPVELNRARMEELHEHLDSGGHAGKISSPGARGQVTGCVLANEFLDAFPARRITRQGGCLMEAVVDWQDDWFAEALEKVSDPDVAAYLDRHSLSPEDGEWLEIQSGISRWIDEVGEVLDRGFVLIVDYGYPAAELFSGHRRMGTLRAYYRHGASTEYYRGIGEQDLTVHVNLGEVEYQATRRGFTPLGVTTQADLLTALGIGDRLMRLQQYEGLSADDYLGIRAAVMRMIDPGAMGRFRALFLARGFQSEHRPRGLGMPDR